VLNCVTAATTFVHVTASVEFLGPSVSYVDPASKKKIAGFAAEEIAKLQREAGTNAYICPLLGCSLNISHASERGSLKPQEPISLP
jgi:hypothetical protein